MIKHSIILYRFTGRQGFFYIPKKWCEECDLLHSLVASTLTKHNLTNQVDLKVRPWWLWWPIPLLRYGSLHAPMLIIDGQLISAGTVPKQSDIEKALT